MESINGEQNSSQPRKMKLTEAAIRNHEELLPNHQSTLQVTDPELIEVFDNFAFDEVISHGGLPLKNTPAKTWA